MVDTTNPIRQTALDATAIIVERDPRVRPLADQNGCPLMNYESGRPEFPENLAQSYIGGNVSQITQTLKSAPDTAVELAAMCEATVSRWNTLDDNAVPACDWRDSDWYGLACRFAFRSIKGIVGEVFVEQEVLADSKELQPITVNDEKKGIDIKTEDETIQVKTTKCFGDEQVSDNCRADRIIVVKTDDGEVIDWMEK